MEPTAEDREMIERDVRDFVAQERSTKHDVFVFKHDPGEEVALALVLDSFERLGCRVVGVSSFPIPSQSSGEGSSPLPRMVMRREVIFRTP